MIMRGFSSKQCPVNNLYKATIFITVAMVTTYLVIGPPASCWPMVPLTEY